MSVHQMVCHLSDCTRLAAGARAAADASGLLQRTVMKWGALYLPVKWPPGILTRPEFDQEQGGTHPIEFAADLAELQALVERAIAALTSAPHQAHDLRHPIFGRMSTRAWLRWAYLHMDHHLRQFGV